MQTLSRLQRNSDDQNTPLSKGVWALAFIGYALLGTFYQVMPPLIGLSFYFWYKALAEHAFPVLFFWMFYAVLIEVLWSLPIFGIWMIGFLFWIFFIPKLGQLVKEGMIFNLILVIFFEITYFAYLQAYMMLTHEKLAEGTGYYLFYFVVDIAGVLLF